MTRACLLALLLCVPVGAQTTNGQPNSRLPLRGNLKVRTVLSRDGTHQLVQKIHPTLQAGRVMHQQTQFDFLGVADASQSMLPLDIWASYRGAIGYFTDLQPQLTAIPGFEWQGQPRLTVYGSDHLIATSQQPIIPPVRIGRVLPFTDPVGAGTALSAYLQMDRQLSRPLDLYLWALDLEALDSVMKTGDQHVTASGLLAAEPVDLGPVPSPGAAPGATTSKSPYPVESMWGRLGSEVSTPSDGAGVSQPLLQEGLKRIGNLSDEITTAQDANIMMSRLLGMLASGSPPDTPQRRIPLPTGWRPIETLVDPVALNTVYSNLYGEYYTYLARGINLLHDYGGGVSVNQSSLEGAREAFLTGRSDQLLSERPLSAYQQWDPLVLDWLERYDPNATLVACLGPGVTPQSLNPKLLTNRPRARDRVALYELLSSGSSRPYYDLALRNGWQVAPSTAADNPGPLGALPSPATGSAPVLADAVPPSRSTFTGIFPGDADSVVRGGFTTQSNLSGGAKNRIGTLLTAFQQRRTYVSQNPYVDALFYGREVSTGKLTMMGDSLFRGAGGGGGDAAVDLVLSLNVQNNPTRKGEPRTKIRDIRLVEVGERPHQVPKDVKVLNSGLVKMSEITDGTFNASPALLEQLIVDETPMVPYYTQYAAGNLPNQPPGIPAMLERYGITGAPVGPAPVAGPGETFPDVEERPLPCTITCRVLAHPHVSGGVIAYYVVAHMSVDGQSGDLVTAPIWTVADWRRFTPYDVTNP